MKTPSIDRMVDSVKLIMVIFVACSLVSVIILLVSTEPGIAIYSFFLGPFTSLRRIGNILEGAIPLMFTALAVIIIFRAGQFSMIAEGSFFIGILGAMMVGISFELPSGLHQLVALLCAGLLGATAASIPAFLKLRWKVSEVVTSIMLNYVIQFFVIYMVNYHFREPLASSLASLLTKETSHLPNLIPGTKVHIGLIIALLVCALGWFFLFRTKAGYRIRLVGDNPAFSRYVGIKTSMVIVSAQIFAGAIAGIGGGIEFLGMYTRFKWTSSPGYGWTGIAVALLARSNPALVPVAALFLAYLNVGSSIMARSSDVSSEIVLIIQGVIMLMIAADALLQGWRQRLIVKNATGEGRNQ
jgi:simple sugar transport system permease protein